MRILITGITGYIGACIARQLLKQHEIYGLVRIPLHEEYIDDIKENIMLYSYDGTCKSIEKALQKSKPDVVYHLATYYTGAHNKEVLSNLLNSNIIFGAHLLEAMAQVKVCNLIYASSITEHYKGKEYCPLNLYAATKRAFFDLACYYQDAGLLNMGVLVLTDTYGPKDNRPKILNIIKRHLGTDIPLALSDGQQEYAAVYIDDIVSAFELAGQQLVQGKWKQKRFQVLPKEIYTLKETVHKLIDISGTTLKAEWGKIEISERSMRKSIDIYPPVPEWIPRVSLEEGLKRFFFE